MAAPKIVLRDRQTCLSECIEVIEADAKIAADNAAKEGKDPAAAALAHTRTALHAVADSLVVEVGDSEARSKGSGPEPTKKEAPSGAKDGDNKPGKSESRKKE